MVFPRYETDLFRFKEGFHVKQDRCHNESHDVPVTKGLIAFAIYIFIIFTVYKYWINKLKHVGDEEKIFIVLTLAAMASYLIQNQFSFGVIAITSLFWVLWALVMNIDTNSSHAEDERVITLDSIPWLYLAIVAVLYTLLVYISMQQFEADKYFKSAKTFMDYKRYNESFLDFKHSMDWFPIEGGTVTNNAIAFLNASFTVVPDEGRKLQIESMKMLDYGKKIDPFNADNFHIASRIFFMWGDIGKALDNANKTLKIDPYYAEAYLTMAEVAERSGDMVKAQSYYAEAVRINPNLAEPL